MRDHTAAVEADFFRFYGLDVRGVWTGKLTFRQVCNLILQLPDESALRKELGGPATIWSHTDYLLAGLIDEMKYQTWVMMKMKIPDFKTEFPKPIRRPGDPEKTEALEEDEITKKFGTVEEQGQKFVAMLGGMMN